MKEYCDKGGGERLFEASSVVSLDGAEAKNSLGEKVIMEIFTSTDTSLRPTIAADGSIDMNGLFELSLANAGAAL